ncbi:hypothetical protein D3C75_1275820 [compost metagenome]
MVQKDFTNDSVHSSLYFLGYYRGDRVSIIRQSIWYGERFAAEYGTRLHTIFDREESMACYVSVHRGLAKRWMGNHSVSRCINRRE